VSSGLEGTKRSNKAGKPVEFGRWRPLARDGTCRRWTNRRALRNIGPCARAAAGA